MPIDTELVKCKLYEIPVEHIEDPTLDFLIREKRIELDRQFIMFREHGAKQFLYGSLQ